jgi:hypothetical protein
MEIFDMNIAFPGDTRMTAEIEIIIDLPLDFPMKYYKAINRVANACGVKKHLAEPPDIVVSTVVYEGR